MSVQLPVTLRIPWKRFGPKAAIRLVLPKEHGSWSLALEPIALGLLTVPSKAGVPLAFAAIAGFFLRHPLKLLLSAKPDPRRSLAGFCAGTLILLAVGGLLFAAQLDGAAQLWPLIPAAGAGAFFVWFDTRNEGREGAAEIAGAAAFALLPATFASLAGWQLAGSLALAIVMLARSVPTVMFVRTLLRRVKGKSITIAPALLITVLATGVLLCLAANSLVPWAVAGISVLLLVRAFWYLRENRSRIPARRLGFMELSLGIVYVLTTAIAWRL